MVNGFWCAETTPELFTARHVNSNIRFDEEVCQACKLSTLPSGYFRAHCGVILLALCRSLSTLYHVFQIFLPGAGASSPRTPHAHSGPSGIRCMRAQSSGNQHAHEYRHCRRITLLAALHAHAWGQVDVDRHLAVEGIHSSWTSESDKCL